MKVKESDFLLSRVSMANGKVGYVGQQMISNGDYPRVKTLKDSEDKIPMPEFETQFKGFAKYACLVLEDIELVDVLSGCKEAETVRIHLMASREDCRAKQIARYQVNSIHFTGSDKDAGVVLVGTKRTAKNKEINFKTPAINFESQLYGFEESIQEDCEELKRLTFEYIYEDKHAEPIIKNPNGTGFGMPEETGDDN